MMPFNVVTSAASTAAGRTWAMAANRHAAAFNICRRFLPLTGCLGAMVAGPLGGRGLRAAGGRGLSPERPGIDGPRPEGRFSLGRG